MTSFYRKYRPQLVEELDIIPVREFFGRVLASGKFAHAYLFAGPKGTGKTSAARILARVLNCDKNQDAKGKLWEPCGECESCRAIESGSSTAVVEIDAASNRGIDDIRALRERVGLVPTQGRYSVFIIDEVHMLTREAFNALLKTLEEPPKHVVFCLCTTEEHKLPETIVSRCTRVVYRKADSQELKRSLARVVAGEKLKVGDEALELIVKRAEGSFRDGVKVLEQLASGGEITAERVNLEVGLGRSGAVENLYGLIIKGRGKEALSELSRIIEGGADVVNLARALLETARERLIEEVTKNAKADARTVTFVEVFSKCFSRFADVPIESLPLEMAIVEFCLEGQDGDGKSQRVRSVEVKGEPEKVVVQNEKLRTKNNNSKLKSENVDEVETSITDKVMVAEDEGKRVELVMSEVQSRWGELLAGVAELNHGLVTILKGAEVRECLGNKLTLGVSYKFHKDQLEQEKYLAMVERAAEQVFGGRVRLVVALSPKRQVSAVEEAEHENIAVVPPEDEELAAAAEEIFG